MSNQDPIFAVKNITELKTLVEYEKQCEEVIRLSKSPSEMSKVILAHKYNIGDCHCSNCQ